MSWAQVREEVAKKASLYQQLQKQKREMREREFADLIEQVSDSHVGILCSHHGTVTCVCCRVRCCRVRCSGHAAALCLHACMGPAQHLLQPPGLHLKGPALFSLLPTVGV